MDQTNADVEVPANQNPVAIDATDQPTAPSSVRDRLRALMKRANEPEPCPACGANAMHRNAERLGWRDWLGLGETDWCSDCGADHEHWSPTTMLRKPLAEWGPRLLLRTAHEVQRAYEDIDRKMTQEQVIMNREYFKRLVAALAPVTLYNFEHRTALAVAAQRWEDLRHEAATLMDQVSGTGMGRVFYKNESGQCSESELVNLINDLKSKLPHPAQP
ncbi:Uncharacterised protein [Burkholderia pseudomallei]|uniref:hypothetical protein n=1 Tax=Burkholderia pseudomallei TaxID=28450 RepID=UPI000F16AE7E|nr:hypothetical protein [Burkholderia pseudomallei]VBM56236.1 Uncharacterised protein [Burkholderia pseudomallei]